jgi:hypothetical protein
MFLNWALLKVSIEKDSSPIKDKIWAILLSLKPKEGATILQSRSSTPLKNLTPKITKA